MLIRRREIPADVQLGETVPPLLRRIYAARRVTQHDELSLALTDLLPPTDLKGIDAACDLLWHMLPGTGDRGTPGRILIISDFDADGATSCALLLRALTQMGFGHVDYIVPDRFTYGYGLSPEIAQLALSRQPDLVVTVDNGISSHEGVALLREAGVAVLITDHHLPASTLPDANAIVNPNQPGCTFASKNLAGVGVAFYLMLALRALLRERQWFGQQGIAEPRLADLLDIVALGTVADLVVLDRNNRILVNEGLRRIRAGRCCAGIRALISQAGRDAAGFTASDLGFVVGPRLNAAGRLEDMAQGIACLLTDDESRAAEIAANLDAINHQRKQIEADMKAQAEQGLAKLQASALASDSLPPALCLFDPGWHQGVVGLVASRIKDRFHRPVVVFADGGTDETGQALLKGSARSIPGLHIRDLLDLLASRQPGLISRFGGHAMAAGLTLPAAHLDDFRAQFETLAGALLSDDDLRQTLHTDGELDASELALPTAELLASAGPWGQGFPEPLFDGEFRVISQRLVGGHHLKLVLAAGSNGSEVIDAIAFNADLQQWPDASVARVRAVYKPDINEYRGQRSLQLIVTHLQPL